MRKDLDKIINKHGFSLLDFIGIKLNIEDETGKKLI
jgi:hypothetical protein